MHSKTRHAGASAAASSKSGVTVALQLLSGERLIADFLPDVSLWDILLHWETKKQLEPSLAALAAEIPVCIYLRKEISTKDSLQANSLRNLGISSGKAAIRYATKQPGVTEQPHVGGILAPQPKPPSPGTMQVAEENVATSTTLKEAASASPQPDLEKPENMMSEIDRGVEMETDVHCISEIPVQNEAHFSEKGGLKGIEDMPGSCENYNSNQPESTQSADEGVVQFLNEKGALVYFRTEENNTVTRCQEESDDFFELTEEEVRKMMQDLIHQTNQLQNAPLITAQLRQEQEEQKINRMLLKYPTTILRVQFRDSLILQLPLSSKTTIAQVKQDVREFIDDSSNITDFEIFTTPPKRILDASLPLYKLGLTPSAHVYISSSCVLKEEHRSNLSSYAGAVGDANQRLRSHSSSKAPSNIEDSNVNRGSKRPASDKSSSSSLNAPRWLKLK